MQKARAMRGLFAERYCVRQRLDCASTDSMTTMQQRYYDPAIGRFLSGDPIAPNPHSGSMFNRYNYASNNPMRFTDPDGRCPTGTRVCMTEATLTKRLEALSVRSAERRHKSANGAARYFAKEALKLQEQAGKEIGANLEKRHDTDYRVVDFHSDGGSDARNHVTTWNYIGEYDWAGIMHTHPGTSLFSGRTGSTPFPRTV